jgi:hypothetical protein
MDLSQTKELINQSIATWGQSYLIWVTVFYVLCAASIVLPLLITAGISGEKTNKVYALITAICVGIVNWSNLGIVAGNFDKSRADLRLALLEYPSDQQKLTKAYEAANARLLNNGPTVLPSTSVTTPPPTSPASGLN